MGEVREGHASNRSATAIRFDADIMARLHEEADQRMVSVNWIVNRLVREGLERLIPLDEFSLTRRSKDAT